MTEDVQNAPLVSVVMITYGHKAFIREAIEGVLMQETDFEVELIIANDCSPDKTEDIVKEIINNNPRSSMIKYTQHEKNMGMIPNFLWALNQANGKYIALCEGDDYWTDCQKLNRQVAFLDLNPDYIMVTENSIWQDLDRKTKKLFSDKSECDISSEDMLKGRQFSTASTLFRNLNSLDLNQNNAGGDIILWSHLIKLGKIRYLTNVSSVYRFHSEGITHMDPYKWALKMQEWNRKIRRLHPQMDRSIFRTRNFGEFKKAFDSALLNKNYSSFFKSVFKCIYYNPKKGTKMFYEVTRDWIKSKLYK